jgi:hypothetical protein
MVIHYGALPTHPLIIDSEGGYQTSMNKCICSIFLLASCASIDVDLGYFNLVKESFSRNSITLTDDLKADLQYSFILLTQDGNQAIYVLSESNDGIDLWVGPMLEKLWTFRGLILKTSGLEQDFGFNSEDWQSISSMYPRSSFKTNVSLTNPPLFGSSASIELRSLSFDVQGCYKEVIYEINLKNLKNAWPATFCLDSLGKAIRSQQKLNPLGKMLYIEFYYQY